MSQVLWLHKFLKKQSWAISQIFSTKFSNLSVYFPLLAHPNWEQPYFKCWAATCGCHIGQSSSRYRHHRSLKNTICLVEPSPLCPQGLCGAQVWLKMQLQQTLPLKQGSLPHWSTTPCPASGVWEAMPVWKRIRDSQRGRIHLHLSARAHRHFHSLSRSHPLRTPHRITQPRETGFPFSNFPWSSPQKKDWSLLLALHSSSGGPMSVREKGQSRGVFSAYWDKLNKQTNKSNNKLYRDMFCFLFSWVQVKKISVVYTISDILHTHTKKIIDLST